MAPLQGRRFKQQSFCDVLGVRKTNLHWWLNNIKIWLPLTEWQGQMLCATPKQWGREGGLLKECQWTPHKGFLSPPPSAARSPSRVKSRRSKVTGGHRSLRCLAFIFFRYHGDEQLRGRSRFYDLGYFDCTFLGPSLSPDVRMAFQSFSCFSKRLHSSQRIDSEQKVREHFPPAVSIWRVPRRFSWCISPNKRNGHYSKSPDVLHLRSKTHKWCWVQTAAL